jgi:hypothetical protein
MQQIYITISTRGTSVEQWIIGPAFRPRPAEREVRDRVHELVDFYGFEFLRTLDDGEINMIEAVGAAVPGTEFEVQILECLKVVIRAMIPDNPAAPQNEKARARRKARERLSARGIASLEQAHTRLRSLRTAQNILTIVRWKTAVAKQKAAIAVDSPEYSSYIHMEEEHDARLEGIIRSKMFATKWKAMSERFSVDEPYHSKLSLGIDAAEKRLSTRIETLHLAYDLKVSSEVCRAELARRCAENLGKIQAESVVGIHLSDTEAAASLSAENWQLTDTASYGPRNNCRRFSCQVGIHLLRADVWSDLTDEKIERITLQLAFQMVFRHQDGSEEARLFDSNRLIILLPD